MAGNKVSKNQSNASSGNAGRIDWGEAKTGPERPPAKEKADSLGDHFIDLADGWRSWRTFCVRGTGFPVAMLKRLTAPEAVAAINHLIENKARFDEALSQAQTQCRQLIEGSDDPGRKALRRLLRQLSKERVPDPLPDMPQMAASLEALVRAFHLKLAAQEIVETSIAETLTATSKALREVAQDSLFREAVAWQNRKALVESLDVLLRTPVETRNRQARRHERLVASYLQRYCAKNETIGFFGPLGWASWSDGGPALIQNPGSELVAARRVHFEYWAVDALAKTLSADIQLRQWLSPRLHPSIRIEGDVLVDELKSRRSITLNAARVLTACDGETRACDIAAHLVADPDCSFQTVDDVHRLLEKAVAEGLVRWSLEVPVGPSPERRLRQTLNQVDAPDLRKKLASPLDRMEAARESVAAAKGDAERLSKTLRELESTFVEITGKDPYQSPGAVYAGRSLVYEDCRRQTEIEIGPDIQKQFGPPLALVLQSARWFTHVIASRFEGQLQQIYAQLKVQSAPQPVPVAALEHLYGRNNTVVRNIVQEAGNALRRNWASILFSEQEDGKKQIELTVKGLHSQVMSAFAAPGPGWAGARHHSADILIVAKGPEAVQTGRCFCVLGEIHSNDTMVMRNVVQQMHPQPEELLDAYQRDVHDPQIFRVTPRNYRGHRKVWDPFLPRDFQLVSDNSPPWRKKDQVLRIADLIIEDSAEGLIVRSRDNTHRFPALAYFERLLWRESFTSFGLLPAAPHTPRITIDELVVKRESWQFPCLTLPFLNEKAETKRFIGARFWVREHGLPRWVFARFPQEFKPIYVDLESPVSVEIMAKMARRAVELGGEAARISLSEMLPNPDQSWLTDAKGNLYTSELRIVAVDPETWNRPGSSAF